MINTIIRDLNRTMPARVSSKVLGSPNTYITPKAKTMTIITNEPTNTISGSAAWKV